MSAGYMPLVAGHIYAIGDHAFLARQNAAQPAQWALLELDERGELVRDAAGHAVGYIQDQLAVAWYELPEPTAVVDLDTAALVWIADDLGAFVAQARAEAKRFRKMASSSGLTRLIKRLKW